MPYTEKEAQRRMMVVICGEGRDKAAISEVNRYVHHDLRLGCEYEGTEADQVRLIEDGQRTKAACWAFFSGEEEPAISILMNSDSRSISHPLIAIEVLTGSKMKSTD